MAAPERHAVEAEGVSRWRKPRYPGSPAAPTEDALLADRQRRVREVEPLVKTAMDAIGEAVAAKGQQRAQGEAGREGDSTDLKTKVRLTFRETTL